MATRPIETHYAGCRFRSRLEARWAVFFDALGIAWEYEPQGYLVGQPGRPYLPDFWLPREKVWVEVKGSEEQLDVELLVHAALPDSGLPETVEMSGYKVRLLILGPLGRGIGELVDSSSGEHVGFGQPTHSVLTFRKGDLFQGSAMWTGSGLLDVEPGGGLIANDAPHIYWDTHKTAWGNLVGGGVALGAAPEKHVAAAYRAARMARFEHGVAGA